MAIAYGGGLLASAVGCAWLMASRGAGAQAPSKVAGGDLPVVGSLIRGGAQLVAHAMKAGGRGGGSKGAVGEGRLGLGFWGFGEVWVHEGWWWELNGGVWEGSYLFWGVLLLPDNRGFCVRTCEMGIT